MRIFNAFRELMLERPILAHVLTTQTVGLGVDFSKSWTITGIVLDAWAMRLAPRAADARLAAVLLGSIKR